MADAKHFPAFWVRFTKGKPACVEAQDADAAKAEAEKLSGRAVARVDRLPYPCEPRLNKHLQPHGSVTPSFCFRPDQCCGRTSCPQRYSCTE